MSIAFNNYNKSSTFAITLFFAGPVPRAVHVCFEKGQARTFCQGSGQRGRNLGQEEAGHLEGETKEGPEDHFEHRGRNPLGFGAGEADRVRTRTRTRTGSQDNRKDDDR